MGSFFYISHKSWEEGGGGTKIFRSAHVAIDTMRIRTQSTTKRIELEATIFLTMMFKHIARSFLVFG